MNNINNAVSSIHPTITKTQVVDKQHSTKTLETSNHSFLTICASTDAITCNGSNSTTMSSNSADGYQTLLKGEIVHLSLDLVTTKSKLNQTQMIIGDYKRKAIQFKLLLEILQNDINTLRDQLVEINSSTDVDTGVVGILTVDEGMNSLEGLSSVSGGGGGA